MRRVVLVTIDGWGTNLLGCYGNPLCETPHLDDLAARSQVFDQCFACSSSLIENLNAILTGRHPLSLTVPTSRAREEETLPIDIRSCFLSDDVSLEGWEGVNQFSEAVFIEPELETELETDPEDDEEDDGTEWASTCLARFMQTAISEWKRFDESNDQAPSWVWIHLSGLTKWWDAPFEYRMKLCDPESDPSPPTTQVPLQFEVDVDTDPDAVFGATCCAAAQGVVLDQLMSWVAAFLDHLPDRQKCLFVVMGTRGYPLGEHRAVGLASESIYNETLHVPLIIQAGTPSIGSREPQLIQGTAVYRYIRQWLCDENTSNRQQAASQEDRAASSADMELVLGAPCYPDPNPEVVLAKSSHGLAIIHGRWSMVSSHRISQVHSPELLQSAYELYLFPDDRWQQNNVATRADEVANALSAFGEACAVWIENEYSTAPPKCDPIVYRAIV